MQPASNACNACARSKRKCNRQQPSCSRCLGRGATCVYWTKPSSHLPLLSRQLPSDLALNPAPLVASGVANGAPGLDPYLRPHIIAPGDLDLQIPTPPDTECDNFHCSATRIIERQAPRAGFASIKDTAWFSSSDTWEVTYWSGASASSPLAKSLVRDHVALLQSWFERWVNAGSSPMIHERLFKIKHPESVQTAYMTLASYIDRASTSSDTILKLVEDRSNDLLRENGCLLEDADLERWKAEGEDDDSGLFEQLSRLVALTVYQLIGLFDGDIRSRYVAEGHLPIVRSWALQLYRSAAKLLSNPSTAMTHTADYMPGYRRSVQQQWSLWILCECIRRTWIISMGMSSIYAALKQRWVVCPGCIMYTSRPGLWDAKDATTWKKCLTSPGDALRVVQEVAPQATARADEFGMAMKNMAFNGQILDAWERSLLGL
jgi:hypothetical protein